jgi:sialidase-1
MTINPVIAIRCILLLLLLSPGSVQLAGQDIKTAGLPGVVPVFPLGEGPYACYRIPAIICLPNGDLLAFAEGRMKNCADFGNVDIVMKRSRNKGKTWTGMNLVVDNGELQAGNSAPVVDLTDRRFPEGRIFLFYNTGTASENDVRQGKGIREVWYVTSSDNGKSWSPPVNITTSVHRPMQPSFNPAYTFTADWRAFANTPGHAMQISSGPFRGRIYIAANHSKGEPLPHYADGRSFGYFSDNHGETFGISEDLPLQGSNEATAAWTQTGGLYLNARNQAGDPRCRIAAFSSDGGATWDSVYYEKDLPDPVCEGSVLAAGDPPGNVLLFSNPASASERKDLTLRISRDGGRTWPGSLLIARGDAAYSDLCPIGKKRFGCLFEKGSDGGIYFLEVKIP